MPNDCSKIRCPFNTSTFKDCSMTCECEYYTKQLTNGDMIKAIFPQWNLREEIGYEYKLFGEKHKFEGLVDEEWWNAPYQKGGKECR